MIAEGCNVSIKKVKQKKGNTRGTNFFDDQISSVRRVHVNFF